MPILEHLDEIRRRLTIIIAILAPLAVGLYFYSPQLIEFLIAPVKHLLPGTGQLTAFDPLTPFAVRFRVAAYGAVIVGSPVIIWQFLAFFMPALKPRERKWAVPTLIAAIFLFLLGNVFCYTIVLATGFEWMLGQAGDFMQVIPSVDSFIKSITLFLLGFGIAFEIPLVVFYLVTFNIVSYKTLRAQWRWVYIVLLVLSAVATPDASPVNMLIMAAALASLYEISLALSYVVSGRRRQYLSQVEFEDDDDINDDW